MSNKTRLQTNNTNLQGLIDKANALPDAGEGGGSGGIETCTVTITERPDECIVMSGATVYVNNALSTQVLYGVGTLNNVVTGSLLAVNFDSELVLNFGYTVTGATLVDYYRWYGVAYFKIDAGVTDVSIYIYND